MDFLKISDASQPQLMEMLSLSSSLKAAHKQGKSQPLLLGKTLLMFFAKNSTRTRVSFETAMTHLGGHAIFLSMSDSQGSRGETLYDTGAAAGAMADFLMARVNSHSDIEELAKGSPVPTINGLSDIEHPCQALADLLTLQECGKLHPGAKLAFVGDCKNNVANSLLLACAMAGVSVSFTGPSTHAPLSEYVKKAQAFGASVVFSEDPQEALCSADAIYTDTWVSMGMEKDAASLIDEFSGYTVDAKMMSYAKEDAIFMHCLPAHRGQEVSAGVIDGPQSVVFQQAENRLHAQKGLLAWLDLNKSTNLVI
ncbi:MAG: ornithine carbamoyltransferase [Candidatus Micrarchaeia archaeon]|jgi:ornithine carbamoyltransferase